MDLSSYLNRLQVKQGIKPDISTLRRLHRIHMEKIPFENLDIVLQRQIKIDEDSMWDKLINQRRGGFCYELNGLFAWLLRQIGFEVTYLNARVFNSTRELGIDFDHLALLVTNPDQAGRWLTDVGFGDSFNEPLNFEERSDQVQELRAYRIEETSEGYITWQRNYDGTWKRQYFFDLQPHKFPDEYEAACLYHQTSPNSSFTRSSIISRATPDGRVSLEDDWLILTTNGVREKRPIAGKDEYKVLLKEHFGVEL